MIKKRDDFKKELVSVVTRKGQVTIPSELREALNLKQGDRVAVVLDPEGTVRLTGPRFPTVASLRGVAVVLKEPLSWEETETIAREDYLDAEYVNGD